MDFTIRKMNINDEIEILSMMEEFYSSDAVYTNGSIEIFKNDFKNCINDSPYLEGFVFEFNDEVLGYSMIARSFSTEFGKECIWLEDLYLKVPYRGNGIVPKFFEYIKNAYPNSILRLEVEKENMHAIHVYKKFGFEELPYMELKFSS